MASALYARRRATNLVALTLSIVTMALGLSALIGILWSLFAQGIQGLNLAVFTQSTPPPGDKGGLLNAIAGSLMMAGVAILAGAPVGVLAGTYLSEFGKGSWLASTVRFINDILLSAPSIIIGLFVYEVAVVRMGHFSGWAGAFALALIAIPVVVRTTENMLSLVPVRLREAAAALGAPQWKVVVAIAYRAARPMNTPLANLPVVIFQFAMSPYADWVRLAWAGSLLITLGVLALNIAARIVFRRKKGE
jgi:phosphate transport system permease protein